MYKQSLNSQVYLLLKKKKTLKSTSQRNIYVIFNSSKKNICYFLFPFIYFFGFAMVSFYSFYPPKPFENPKKETLLDELNFDSSSSDQIPIFFQYFIKYKYVSNQTHIFSSLLFSSLRFFALVFSPHMVKTHTPTLNL